MPKPRKDTLKSLRSQLELVRQDLNNVVAEQVAKRHQQWVQYNSDLNGQRAETAQARKAIAGAHELFVVATTQFEVLATSLSLLNRLAREAEKKAGNAVNGTRKRLFAAGPKVETAQTFNELRESLSLIAKLLEEGGRRADHFAQSFAAAKNPNGCNETEAQSKAACTNAAGR